MPKKKIELDSKVAKKRRGYRNLDFDKLREEALKLLEKTPLLTKVTLCRKLDLAYETLHKNLPDIVSILEDNVISAAENTLYTVLGSGEDAQKIRVAMYILNCRANWTERNKELAQRDKHHNAALKTAEKVGALVTISTDNNLLDQLTASKEKATKLKK